MTPSDYASLLLQSVGSTAVVKTPDNRSASMLWRASGAMWLTGFSNESPRDCLAPVASAMRGAWLALCSLCPDSLNPCFDAHGLLGERAALTKLRRGGTISAGGAAHLLQTAHGWMALNLARDDDWSLMPAWLEVEVTSLAQIRAAVGLKTAAQLVDRGRLMGLAVAAMPDRQTKIPFDNWLKRQRLAPRVETLGRRPLVLDLSSLWAGPLCAQMLQECGARVIRVESSKRPDGARFGSAAFYDLLNGGKESVALQFDTSEGQACLKELLAIADIVIEGSRPRALENLGIDATSVVAQGQSKVWVSITGYGRSTGNRDWIAFGDDAAVAAGLANATGSPPVFCADAIADPLTGLHAAVAALQSWQGGGGELLDVSLFSVAQSIASLSHTPTANPPNTTARVSAAAADALGVERPRARTAVAKAAQLGAHTKAVLAEVRRLKHGGSKAIAL